MLKFPMDRLISKLRSAPPGPDASAALQSWILGDFARDVAGGKATLLCLLKVVLSLN
jgi:hypothetical protein